MGDPSRNQDEMFIGQDEDIDPTYRDASYLGTDEDDSEEVRDLGFIVEDHDDRRASILDHWQRLDDLDTDEPLEVNPNGPIPHQVSLAARGPSPEVFATDYHVEHAEAEEQEEDFNETSMLKTDPYGSEGEDDFTSDTLRGIHGERSSTDLIGQVPGVSDGFGTTLAQDLGSGGFQIEDNPLMQPAGAPISGENLGDVARGIRDVDEIGSDEELDELADRASRQSREEAA